MARTKNTTGRTTAKAEKDEKPKSTRGRKPSKKTEEESKPKRKYTRRAKPVEEQSSPIAETEDKPVKKYVLLGEQEDLEQPEEPVVQEISAEETDTPAVYEADNQESSVIEQEQEEETAAAEEQVPEQPQSEGSSLLGTIPPAEEKDSSSSFLSSFSDSLSQVAESAVNLPLTTDDDAEDDYTGNGLQFSSDVPLFNTTTDLPETPLTFDKLGDIGGDTVYDNTPDKLEETMANLVASQRAFFNTNQTRDVNWRITQLKKLHSVILENEETLYTALRNDLSKAPFESYSSEVGLVLHEITVAIKNLKKWARPKKHFGDLVLFPGKLSCKNEPYGVALVLSTWNYPFLLSMEPVVAAIAAGNTVVLKTSEYATATNNLMQSMVEKNFNASFFSVVQGGYSENHALLDQHFDFIFFTGSQNVGRIVMTSAARFLTPVCLELGGKSPCIVDSSANIPLAARRIAWGKFLNAGQTCVAPDYVLVDRNIKDTFIEALQKEITRQYGENPLENPDYPKIINERRFVHLSTFCPDAPMDFVSNKIAPTVLDLGDVRNEAVREAPVMKEEIFGPILPVITFDNTGDAMTYIASCPPPLALYIFSTSKETTSRFTTELRFGGGCVNDVVMHIVSSKVPFGGFGDSGMGNYHGKAGFDTFSHKKSIMYQSATKDLNVRYQPYSDKQMNLIKKVLK